MSDNTNYVGPQANVADGLAAFHSRRVDRGGAGVVTELHGKYYEQTRRKRAYFGVSASAGIALIVPATTGGHPTLWNPSDSGRNLSIIRLELTYVSGTNAPTALEWAVTKSTGAGVATGAPIATATRVAVENCLVGAGLDNKAVWSPTTNTFTVAPAFLRPAGISLATMAAASTPPPFPIVANYDGDFAIAPGTAISLCSQAATTTALFQVCVVFEEIDIDP